MVEAFSRLALARSRHNPTSVRWSRAFKSLSIVVSVSAACILAPLTSARAVPVPLSDTLVISERMAGVFVPIFAGSSTEMFVGANDSDVPGTIQSAVIGPAPTFGGLTFVDNKLNGGTVKFTEAGTRNVSDLVTISGTKVLARTNSASKSPYSRILKITSVRRTLMI